MIRIVILPWFSKTMPPIHMTVYDNMAFGLKLRKYSKEDIDKRVQEAAEILGLKEFRPQTSGLSGGQRQR